MLFVDDDQAQPRIGQEQRRAGADDHRHLPFRHRPPGPPPFGTAQIGMPLRRRRAEASGKAAAPLRTERDFRQQHQHLPAVRQRFVDIGQGTWPREQQTQEALAALQKAEIEKWWPIIKAANIKAE